mmetsp:Transcript_47177/g.86387  ORF Transcript_47177/g.86387 Transcript_47177/m.86387 type:complete len:310 (-) Transcript_47177:105-1034(-)
MKLVVLIALFVGWSAHTNNAVDLTDETSLMQLSIKQNQMSQFKMRPKAEWEEPLTKEEEAVFGKDMRMPIIQWNKENPSLNSDYFSEFGPYHGFPELFFWGGVHNVTDYVKDGQERADLWKNVDSYLGEGQGPRATWSLDGDVITSRHLDNPDSYLGHDVNCYALGWLKGQGLDGTLMSDKSAWDALAAQECDKIGDTLSTYLPVMNHTVYRHVNWNRVWPVSLNCNIIDGPRDFSNKTEELDVDCTAVDCSMLWNGNPSTCKPVTKNNLLEHTYRMCLLNFAQADMSFCYMRGCVINGNEIGHGPECD